MTRRGWFGYAISMSDYETFLIENGLTEAAMAEGLKHAKVNSAIQPGIIVLASNIHGVGVHAQHSFVKGESIAEVYGFKHWTLAGRYTNHAAEPNAEVVDCGHAIFALGALKHISCGEEITANYRQVKLVMGNEAVLT